MIPYVPQPRFHAMGVSIYAFGVCAAAALLFGWWGIVRRAGRLGLDRAPSQRLTACMLTWGFVGSHVLYLLLHRAADLVREPWRLLNPSDGIYSFGGLVSGVLAALWCARRYQFTRPQLSLYLDAVGFVFPFCWTIARAGCALAHDHVGIASASWVAVRFPGGSRLDLGLVEALASAGAAVCFFLLDRLKLAWPPPFFFGLVLACNGIFRLWLDTLQFSSSAPDRAFAWGSALLGSCTLALAWRKPRSASYRYSRLSE